LSPVLGSLTQMYSSDTVTILIRVALAIHLLAMDTRQDVPAAWTSPISFNAGFAATLLMASRLRSTFLIFSFAVLCAALLVFLPASMKRKRLPSFALAFITLLATLHQLGFRSFLVFATSAWFIGIHSPRVLQRDAAESVQIVGKWDLLHVEEEEETGLVPTARQQQRTAPL